mgnify:CR=1 FL=1
MKKTMSRRSFLGMAGLAGASVAGAGMLAGCSQPQEDGAGSSASSNGGEVKSKAQYGNSDAKDSYDFAETKRADVVVVGGGSAGCSAATRAGELGMSVILVEQADKTGGTSIMTEGLFAINSHWQKELGVNPPDLGYDLFTKAMDYHHWLANGHLLRTLMDASASNVDWMESVGITFKGTGTMCENEYNTWHVYETREGEISGSVYVEKWREAAENAGAEIITNTKAVDTLMEDGAVCAVVCKQGSDYLKIETKAVVFACGGYGDNEQMVEELTGMKQGQYVSMGMGGRSGLGIAMGRAAGAALADAPGTCMFYGGNLPGIQYGTELYCATAFQPLFWVNQNAQRFINEWYSERNFNFSGNGQSKQDKVFSILTKAQMDGFVNEGCIFGCGEYIKGGTKLTGLWDEYNDQVEKNNPGIFEADTLDELAEKTGLDATALKKTVEHYNEICAAGEDTEFSKDPAYLIPLEEGPYYAFELKTGFFTTVGGLKVNDRSQVLDAAGEPITGMYAAGCDAGGLYGDSYDVSICEGSQQAWGVHSGKTAAEHIKETLV